MRRRRQNLNLQLEADLKQRHAAGPFFAPFRFSSFRSNVLGAVLKKMPRLTPWCRITYIDSSGFLPPVVFVNLDASTAAVMSRLCIGPSPARSTFSAAARKPVSLPRLAFGLSLS